MNLWIIIGFWAIIFCVFAGAVLYVANAEAKDKAEADWRAEQDRIRREVRFANLRNKRKYWK